MPEQITAEVAEPSDQDIDQILSLNTLEYGPKDIIATRADFEWRCDQNPAGPAAIPVIRDRRGRVVGFMFMVPMRVRIKGEDYRAAMGSNLVIQPEYRNTFGYVKLIRKFEQTLRDKDIPLHFSFISEENYQQLRASGNQTAHTIPLLIKPFNFKVFVDDYFTGKWQRLVLRQAGRLVSPVFFRKLLLHGADEIVVRTIENFDAGFDEFWRLTKDRYPVMVIRDRAFLSWRFAPVSGRTYHILAAYRRGRIMGYMVIRCATVRGVKTGLILDLLVRDDHPLKMKIGTCLMSQAEVFFRTRGMSVAAALMLPQAIEYRILRKCGYWQLPAAISPMLNRFVFFIHNGPQERLKAMTIEDWFVTLADYETH
jgi:L-amino acid N-acyltransferase YncA